MIPSSALYLLAVLTAANAITIVGYVSIPCYKNSIVVATCANIQQVSALKLKKLTSLKEYLDSKTLFVRMEGTYAHNIRESVVVSRVVAPRHKGFISVIYIEVL